MSKRLGAKTTPNSGATPHAKGDAVNRDYRIEMKTTASKKCPLDADVLETIWHQATATGHTPLIVVTMESIRHPVARDWVLVELDVFEQLSGYTHTKDK